MTSLSAGDDGFYQRIVDVQNMKLDLTLKYNVLCVYNKLELDKV